MLLEFKSPGIERVDAVFLKLISRGLALVTLFCHFPRSRIEKTASRRAAGQWM
jgi:hypothetical protein